MEQLLKLEEVSFRYGKEPVLNNISLDVGRGEVLGILGPNGSGKSTLLRLVSRLIKPEKGKITLKGRPLAGYSRASLAREIAMVAQESHFSFSFSVLEVVLMGRFAHLGSYEFEGERDIEVARRAMAATRTLELSDRTINEISGGEKQRVLFARALAQEPSLILLDEPTAFLDLSYKKEIFDLISYQAHETGVSALVVTHDIDLAARCCKRLAVLKAGVLVATGTPEEVLKETTLELAYGCRVFVDKNPLTGSPRVALV